MYKWNFDDWLLCHSPRFSNGVILVSELLLEGLEKLYGLNREESHSMALSIFSTQ